MKQLVFFFLVIAATLSACNNNEVNTGTDDAAKVATPENSSSPIPGTQVTQEQLENLKPNANIPTGVFAVKKVNFAPEISEFMVQKGTRVFDEKCKSCHTIKGAGGTASAFEAMYERHDPAWVMNMVRNVPMDDLDRQLKKCPVRTPEGALEVMDARDLLEMIRSVSPVKVEAKK